MKIQELEWLKGILWKCASKPTSNIALKEESLKPLPELQVILLFLLTAAFFGSPVSSSPASETY